MTRGDSTPFSSDEGAMLAFLAICQASLDPDHYGMALQVCRVLCANRRPGLRDDSLERCLEKLGKDFNERMIAKGILSPSDL